MDSISLIWNTKLAYAVGLITTDGCLSKDKRHIDFTSKDFEQVLNFQNCLNINVKYRLKNSGSVKEKIYYSIQFSNVKLYKFLNGIGLYPNKSKTLAEVKVPSKYFADFLRGLFDGDGYSTSYWSNQHKNSYVLYTGFVSASLKHLKWLQRKIYKLFKIKGSLNLKGNTYQLRFAKYSSLQLIQIMYYKPELTCLSRKKFKLNQSLCIIQEQLSGSAETGRQACLRSMCRKTWRSESSRPHIYGYYK